MVNTTNTTSQVTATTTTGAAKHDGQTTSSNNRRPWLCSLCEMSFGNEHSQREHMKHPWHVYNSKRRMAKLPALPLEIYDTQVAPTYQHVADKTTVSAAPYQCLFCHQGFDTYGLQQSIEHMSIAHGFFVPDLTLLLDIESLLGYLATVVYEWHECLYCGTVRDRTTAIQSHMRDKGHCKLNLDREPELMEFWERKSQAVRAMSVKASSYALVPSSDRSGVSRTSLQKQDKAPRSRGTVALRTDAVPQVPRPPPLKQACRQLARRDEMGMLNITAQQRQALVLTVKRSQKEQSIASRANEWSHAKRANKQKYDQDHGPLAYAKGGMHNLLPR